MSTSNMFFFSRNKKNVDTIWLKKVPYQELCVSTFQVKKKAPYLELC